MSPESAAQWTQLTESTILKHIRSGKLPAHKHDGEWRITPGDFADWNHERLKGKVIGYFVHNAYGATIQSSTRDDFVKQLSIHCRDTPVPSQKAE